MGGIPPTPCLLARWAAGGGEGTDRGHSHRMSSPPLGGALVCAQAWTPCVHPLSSSTTTMRHWPPLASQPLWTSTFKVSSGRTTPLSCKVPPHPVGLSHPLTLTLTLTLHPFRVPGCLLPTHCLPRPRALHSPGTERLCPSGQQGVTAGCHRRRSTGPALVTLLSVPLSSTPSLGS